MAADEASLSAEIDSMSDGLSWSMLPGTPSMSMSGELELTEPVPRIEMEPPAPGEPVLTDTLTPGMAP